MAVYAEERAPLVREPGNGDRYTVLRKGNHRRRLLEEGKYCLLKCSITEAPTDKQLWP